MLRAALSKNPRLVFNLLLLTLLALAAGGSGRAQGSQRSAYAPVIHNQYTYRGAPVLLISEVYPNPPGSSQEPEEEWVELYNPGTQARDLTLYLLGDAAQAGEHEGMYSFPAGAQLPPQGVIVIANHALAYQAVSRAAARLRIQPHPSACPRHGEGACVCGRSDRPDQRRGRGRAAGPGLAARG